MGQVTAVDVEAAEASVQQLSALVQASRSQLNRSRLQTQQSRRDCRGLSALLEYRKWLDDTVSRWGAIAIIIAATLADVILLSHWAVAPASVSLIVAAIALPVASCFAAWLTVYPSDRQLSDRIRERAEALSRLDHTIAHLSAQLKSQESTLARESDRSSQLSAAFYSRRRAILTAPWQEFTGTDFERFLQQVFEEIGHTVQLVGQTGDQGVDLIVTLNGRRTAIQAKGYPSSTVGNGAIQEVHAGMTYHSCHCSVVVTNSRFTSSARALAERVGCQWIDGSQMTALIEGRIRV